MTDHHDPLTALQRADLELAVQSYERALGGSLDAVQWLLGRGLSRETVERFRLGFVREPKAGHQMYRGMLAIPFLSGRDQHPVMLRYRCIEEHDHRANGHGKYNSMSGEANRMFNSGAILTAAPDEPIHVCEGEIDSMILSQLGYSAVAITGANAFKKHHAIMLEGVERVFVWGDGDKAGGEFTTAVKKFLKATAVGMDVPDGYDVNDLYLEHGEDFIHSMIERRSK